MKRVLMIDAQVFHTVAWHRGMGKYSTELITAISKLNDSKKRWDSIEILLSSKLPLENEVLAMIKAKIDNPKFIYLDLARDEITNATAIMQHNRKTLDEHIEKVTMDNTGDLKVEFLILSPMQGGICSVFPTSPAVHKATVFYDLIPFMFHDIYFRNKIAEMEFLTKLVELLKADVYFAISKTVANDLAVYLGVDPGRIKSIDGGPIEHAKSSKKFNVNKPFILMPTGNDLRKNNRVGIQGFNEFNRKHDNSFTLVITSYFDPDQIAELSKMAENVVFTGNISGEELNYLYEECEVLLFPSEYEGLGLPVLEAAEKNKPVACSDIMVFREISKNAFQFFDPAYGTEIAAALDRALTTTIDKDVYAKVLKKYTWEVSATAAIRAFESIESTQVDEKRVVTVFSPNPESKSTAARTVQRLHSELSRHYAPSYFIEGVYTTNTPRPNMLPFVSDTINISKDVPIRIKSDSIATIYHIEDGQDSSMSLFSAIANPGIVVLHTLDIADAWRVLFERGIIPEDRYKKETSLDKKFQTEGTQMLVSLLSNQKAIIVFSDDAKVTIERLLKKLKVTTSVFTSKYPVSSLVYKDLIPFKKGLIGTANLPLRSHALAVFNEFNSSSFEKLYIADSIGLYNNIQDSGMPAVKVGNDRSFENNISRLDLIVSSGDHSDIAAIEAARYAVVPTYIDTAQLKTVSLPKNSLTVGGIGELMKAVDGFTLNTNREKLSHDIQLGVEKQNSYRTFVGLITIIINGLENEWVI